MNKHPLTLLLILISFNFYSQSEKDSLLKTDYPKLFEELKFMYNYDQATREYLFYQTFDKHITDSIENLNDNLKDQRIAYLPVKSDSLNDKIWKYYINPMDKLHTQRLIEIIDKYGFPSTKRLKEISNDSIDFNPLIILIHSPKEFSEDLKVLMTKEKEKNRIKKCEYGYLLWHLNGRSDFQPMLDNGYEMTKKEDGTFHLKAVDCD